MPRKKALVEKESAESSSEALSTNCRKASALPISRSVWNTSLLHGQGSPQWLQTSGVLT